MKTIIGSTKLKARLRLFLAIVLGVCFFAFLMPTLQLKIGMSIFFVYFFGSFYRKHLSLIEGQPESASHINGNQRKNSEPKSPRFGWAFWIGVIVAFCTAFFLIFWRPVGSSGSSYLIMRVGLALIACAIPLLTSFMFSSRSLTKREQRFLVKYIVAAALCFVGALIVLLLKLV